MSFFFWVIKAHVETLIRIVFDSVEFHEVKTRLTRRLIKAKVHTQPKCLALNCPSLGYRYVIWFQIWSEKFVVVCL